MQRIPLIPIASGAKFPITHLQPLTIRPLTSVTGTGNNPIPMTMEALNSTKKSEFSKKVSEPSVVYAKQLAPSRNSTDAGGTSKKTGEQFVKEMSKVAKSIKTKPNILPKKNKVPKQEGAPATTIPGDNSSKYDEYYLKDKDGHLHHHLELKSKYYRDVKQEDGSVLRIQNTDASSKTAPPPPDYISAEEYARVQKLKETCVRVSLEEGKKMLEADKQQRALVKEEEMTPSEGLDLTTKDSVSSSRSSVDGRTMEGSSDSDSESDNEEGESSDSGKSDEDDDSSSEDSDEQGM